MCLLLIVIYIYVYYQEWNENWMDDGSYTFPRIQKLILGTKCFMYVVPFTNIFLQCVCLCLRDIYAFFFVLLSQA